MNRKQTTQCGNHLLHNVMQTPLWLGLPHFFACSLAQQHWLASHKSKLVLLPACSVTRLTFIQSSQWSPVLLPYSFDQLEHQHVLPCGAAASFH